MAMIEIINLHVSKGKKKILKGVNLKIQDGEIHALLGPNGHGKTTLLLAIAGHPDCHIEQGDILFNGESILSKSVDERARVGIFLTFQAPVEVPGVNTAEFIKSAINERRKDSIKLFEFYQLLNKATEEVGLGLDVTKRYLNQGFSGGEKKKNEILQLKILKPQLALFDEIDSGLDVDASKIIAEAINSCKDGHFSALIISHYAKFFDLLAPTIVHLLVDGQIVQSGGVELIKQIDEKGFSQTINEKKIILGGCGANKNDNL